jgi:stage II sporulation protein M
MNNDQEFEGATYLSSIRTYVLVSFTLFIGFLILGYDFGGRFNIGILQLLRDVFGEASGGQVDPFFILALVFVNNSVKSFLSILLGVLFGIAPVIFVAGNGLILGIFVYEVQQESGLAYTAAGLLPHGIIEVPTVLVSAAVGLRMGYELVRYVQGRGHIDTEFKRGAKFFLRYLLPLLLVAALVEAFLTPVIVDLVT